MDNAISRHGHTGQLAVMCLVCRMTFNAAHLELVTAVEDLPPEACLVDMPARHAQSPLVPEVQEPEPAPAKKEGPMGGFVFGRWREVECQDPLNGLKVGDTVGHLLPRQFCRRCTRKLQVRISGLGHHDGRSVAEGSA